MKQLVASAACGLLIAASALLPGGGTAHAAAHEAPAQTMVLHGCVITADDDTVVFRIGGTGANDGRVIHVNAAGIPDYDPATTADACGAIVVYQQDGLWYAESISVTRDDDGDVTVTRGSGTRPVGPRGR